MAREKGPTLTERVQDHYENDFEYHAFTPDVVRKGILRVIEAKKSLAERRDAVKAKDVLLDGTVRIMAAAKELPGMNAVTDKDGVTRFSLNMKSGKNDFSITLDSKDGKVIGSHMTSYEEELTRSFSNSIDASTADQFLHDSEGSPVTTETAEAWLGSAQSYVDDELSQHNSKPADAVKAQPTPEYNFTAQEITVANTALQAEAEHAKTYATPHATKDEYFDRLVADRKHATQVVEQALNGKVIDSSYYNGTPASGELDWLKVQSVNAMYSEAYAENEERSKNHALADKQSGPKE